MTAMLITEVFPPKVGGSGRWLWEVYSRLPKTQVVVAAGDCPGAEEFDQGHDLPVTRLPLTLPSWGLLDRGARRRFVSLLGTIGRLARARGVRRVQCGKCLPEGLFGLALLWLTRTPYSCFVHGEELTVVGDSRELLYLTRAVLGRAEFLIANSRNTAQLLTESWGVPPSRVKVVHPGVETGRYVPAPRDTTARGRLGWGDRPVVLTVGRLVRRKGQDMMIRALPAVRRRVPDVLYAVVGLGEDREHLERLARDEGVSGHIRFMGELPDDAVAECYRQCDLFALPNRRVGLEIEGFGMVLVEAQASGRPVLAGASGGTAETMRPGETGVVVPCEEPGPLADAVADLLSDPDRLARMGRAAREWVVEQFDWEAVTRRIGQLILPLPGGARSGSAATSATRQPV